MSHSCCGSHCSPTGPEHRRHVSSHSKTLDSGDKTVDIVTLACVTNDGRVLDKCTLDRFVYKTGLVLFFISFIETRCQTCCVILFLLTMKIGVCELKPKLWSYLEVKKHSTFFNRVQPKEAQNTLFNVLLFESCTSVSHQINTTGLFAAD